MVSQEVGDDFFMSTPIDAPNFDPRLEHARQLVRGPAIALGTTAFISMGIPLVLVVYCFLTYEDVEAMLQKRAWFAELFRTFLVYMVPTAILLLPPGAMMLAAFEMKRLRHPWLVDLGCVIAVLPLHLAWPFGLAAGTWAVDILAKDHVIEAFRRGE